MNGQVDGSGRALVRVQIKHSEDSQPHVLQAWIDTGFNGELVLPEILIREMGLVHSGSVTAMLADGTEVALDTFTCFVEWFGSTRHLEVVANEGTFPLLGVGLLIGFDLHISYRTGEIRIS